MLKQEYKEGETDLKAALDLAIKVLSKTLDTNKLTHEKGKNILTPLWGYCYLWEEQARDSFHLVKIRLNAINNNF